MKFRTFAATITAILLAFPLTAADIPELVPTISVSGTAEVTMYPDTAEFTITASFTEDTTEEAREKTSEMINTAADILINRFGISKEDISTSYITAYPEYQWRDDEKVLIGQRVSQSLDVSTDRLESIGEIYTELMALDGITLSDVSLDKADKSEEYREARMNAVRDAYAKASAYAEAAGVSVGQILSISDSSTYAAPLYRSANMMLASADTASKVSTPTEFYSGEISVSASVSIMYGIDQ